MIADRLEELGFPCFEPAALRVLDRFHAATRVGNLVFTSGQTSTLGDLEVRGKVGDQVDIEQARRAAALCTVKCIQAAAAVVDVESIVRPVKVLGMVNVADGFFDTSAVINACSELLTELFGARGEEHVRSAVGVVLPGNWSVEIEMVFEVLAHGV